MNEVTILNPHDSQGNHIADGNGIYPCLRGCGGAGYQQGYVLQHLKDSNPSLIILNDQGGSVMDVQENVTATLRAQDHGHPPVICFEPGIMSRDCSAGNRAYVDICSTLRAQMGDNQPAVCYEKKKVYIIDAMSSNSFKSSNPYSGIHETQVSKCLDTMCLNPSCNQGGELVVYEQRKVSESVGRAE